MIYNYKQFLNENFRNKLDEHLFDFIEDKLKNTHYEIIYYEESKHFQYIEINDTDISTLNGDISNTILDIEAKDFSLLYLENIINELDSDRLNIDESTEEFIKILKPIIFEYKNKYEHLINANNFDLI